MKSTLLSLTMLPSTTDDHIFDNLSPGDLYRYRRTCKNNKDAIDSYIRRHFRLNDILGQYFESDEEIFEFRRLQSLTGMFISGSAALQFFERKIYPESDLDLYVEHQFRRIIARWFVRIGYKYIPPALSPNETLEEAFKARPDYIHRNHARFYSTTPVGYVGAATILNFVKDGRKIQLITNYHAVLQMVLNYHSTCVMNVITHEKAYSIFPRATFDERRSLVLIPTKTSRLEIATAKYKARGWTMIQQITDEDFDDPYSAFSYGQRHLGDRKCWTLPISPKLDVPIGKTYYETNSWSLLYDKHLLPSITCTAFVSPTLRYGYLIADEPLRKYVSKISLELEDEAQEDDEELDHLFTAFIEEYRVSKMGLRTRP